MGIKKNSCPCSQHIHLNEHLVESFWYFLVSSFDVKSLYSNIPNNFGLTAIKYWIDKYPETLPERISKEFIIQGMKFILENNFFLFNGKAYKQIKGTAMGTKVAPTYANLVMGYWETFLYKEVTKHFM